MGGKEKKGWKGKGSWKGVGRRQEGKGREGKADGGEMGEGEEFAAKEGFQRVWCSLEKTILHVIFPLLLPSSLFPLSPFLFFPSSLFLFFPFPSSIYAKLNGMQSTSNLQIN